jgi:pullulanase/glycogen debranching enzyme
VGLGMEYDFPTDARSLGSEKLGGLRLMLSAYHGYALWLTGKEEVELDAFKAVYDMLLGRAMDEAQRAKEKRAVKEILRSVAIMENEDLKRLTRAIIEREARVGRLKNQLAIYEAHLSTLSREQSRRESEARTGII